MPEKINKPGAQEDQFFSEEDRLAIEKLREKVNAEKKAREAEMLKQAHWMRCPKCGNEMEEVPYRTVIVDQCQNCGYVGFDKGELDIVAGHESHFFEHVLSLFKSKPHEK